MKKKTMGKLYAPIICMLLLLVLVIVEQAGFMTETRAPVLDAVVDCALSGAWTMVSILLRERLLAVEEGDRAGRHLQAGHHRRHA